MVEFHLNMKRTLTLVITGSVAAVKAGQIVHALEKRGFDLSCLATVSARPFLVLNKKYGLDAATLEKLKNSRVDPAEISAGPLLIAPATAETIAQLALNADLGKILRSKARPLFIAPAMNVMMWHHPAVQKNIRALIRRGAVILGPAHGGMACGDTGFGRMAEPEEIAKAVALHLAGKSSPLARVIMRPAGKPQRPPTCDIKDLKSDMLVFADDAAVSRPLTKKFRDSGFDLRVITRRFAHYQTDPQGMEHIRLPESARTLVFAGLEKDLARDMARGRARSFAGCLYLASKAPVIIVPSTRNPPAKRDLAILRRNGARILTPRQAAALKPRLTIAVLGGQIRETVDSFRFYANLARPKDLGRKTAEALRQAGHDVTLIDADGDTATLMQAAEKLSRRKTFDAVLQLALIPPVVCPAPAGHKIAKTGHERHLLFRVRGNIDATAALKRIFPGARIAGFDARQNWFGPEDFKKWLPAARQEKAAPSAKPMDKNRIIVTTGPTREPLDRKGTVITNGFTGLQGQEIARALARMGYDVTLVSGPCLHPHPEHPRIAVASVETYAQMSRTVLRLLQQKPLAYISAAAIADFSLRPAALPDLDPGEEYDLPLAENHSLVGQVAGHRLRPPVVVSFAAQSPQNVLDYACKKFEKLGVDMTVANPIGEGQDPARNKISLITRGGIRSLPNMSKAGTAHVIARAVADLLIQKDYRSGQPRRRHHSASASPRLSRAQPLRMRRARST